MRWPTRWLTAGSALAVAVVRIVLRLTRRRDTAATCGGPADRSGTAAECPAGCGGHEGRNATAVCTSACVTPMEQGMCWAEVGGGWRLVAVVGGWRLVAVGGGRFGGWCCQKRLGRRLGGDWRGSSEQLLPVKNAVCGAVGEMGIGVLRVDRGWTVRVPFAGRARRPPAPGGIRTRGGTPCVTFRRVVAPLRGPGQSPVLLFACCVGSLRSVGRCGRCSCWCRFRVRGAQSLVCWGCAGCGGMCRLRVSGAQ